MPAIQNCNPKTKFRKGNPEFIPIHRQIEPIKIKPHFLS